MYQSAPAQALPPWSPPALPAVVTGRSEWHPRLRPLLRAPGVGAGPDEAAAHPPCSHDPVCLQRGLRWHHLPSTRETPPSQLAGNGPVHMGLAARRPQASASPAPRGSSTVPVATLVSQQRSPAAAHAAPGAAECRCQLKAIRTIQFRLFSFVCYGACVRTKRARENIIRY